MLDGRIVYRLTPKIVSTHSAIMASSQTSSEVPHLVALIKTLTNPQLKDLLRNEGLAVSGVKASLQMRIIDCSLRPPRAVPSHFLQLSPTFPPSIPYHPHIILSTRPLDSLPPPDWLSFD